MSDALITLDEVHKSFGAVTVLRGLTLTVQRGETLVVIGQSGVGKSVTLRLFLGLLAPTTGECRFQGRDIAAMDEDDLTELRSHFAMLFQNGALFDSMTIAQNIAFPAQLRGVKNRDELQGIVEEKLYQVGLGKARFPDMPDKMPSMVSGGQRKRIALARALAQEPEIMLYDEPTTGLDPIMSDAVADLIIATRQHLAHKNLTSIVITHDMQVAFKTGDRIIMLNAGVIAAAGTPDYFREISARPDADGMSEKELMIRQFVRGEARGPIQAVQ
ncbi:ABC transporter ATP-binding protein [Planctomycetales bacterium]|nr:ABC transporter ATP-binding protein [Planctomycetales bacterium]